MSSSTVPCVRSRLGTAKTTTGLERSVLGVAFLPLGEGFVMSLAMLETFLCHDRPVQSQCCRDVGSCEAL